MSPIQSRRILRDFSSRMQRFNNLPVSEYDRLIKQAAKFGAAVLAVFLVGMVLLQVNY